MRPGLLRLCISAAAVAVVLAGCSKDDAAARKAVEEALEEGVGQGGVVDLSEVPPEDWNRLTFVCPYENASSVNERLGFDWGDFPSEMQNHDRHSYFVFAGADDVSASVRVERRAGDPCGRGETPPTVAREDAKFRLDKVDETVAGDDFFSLVPVTG